MAGIRFVGQPFYGQFGVVLAEALRQDDFRSLRLAVAWGKRSGLSRLTNEIRAFRDRGGDSEAILGVDEGGATEEGLRLAQQLFDRPFIFHDPGTKTFHPKVYLLEGPTRALAGIGSWNLTKGGLFTNYEAGVILDLDMAADGMLVEEIRRYLDAFHSFSTNCLVLDDALIDRLIAERRFGIEPESSQNRRQRALRRARGEDEEAEAPIFGGAITGLPGAPPPVLPEVEAEEEDDDDSVVVPPMPPSAPFLAEEPIEPSGTMGFWKALSNFDVSTSGAPGQIILPIRYLDSFGPMTVQRDDTATGGVRQSHVIFPVTFIDGAETTNVPAARAILYEPAEFHPRPNKELRFAFHNRDILLSLSANDILVFSRDGDRVTVERRPRGSMGSGRFGPL